MALKVPIRFRGDTSETGLEAERIFNMVNWYILHSRTNNALKIIIARALEGLEITFQEWIVMKSIVDNEQSEVTVSSLAEMFDMNMPQTAVLIKSLIKRNLVRQKVSLKDRRVKYLSCSRRGIKLVYDGDQAIQHAMRYWLFDLTDSEIVTYLDITKKISNFEIPPTQQL